MPAGGLVALGAIGVAGGLASGIGGYFSDKSKAEQSQANAQQYMGLMQGQQGANTLATQQGQGQLAAGYQGAQNTLGQYGDYANLALSGGYGDATQTLKGAASLAGGPLGQGYQQSPGYQFQMQQGQQALAAQNASAGGRDSGAAQKQLLQYSQGLANQDYQQFVGNQMAQRGQQLGAMGNLAGMQANSGAALGNLWQGLGGGMAGLQAQSGAGMAGLGMQGAGMNSALTQSAGSALMGQQAAPSALGATFSGIGGAAGSVAGLGMGYLSGRGSFGGG